jgi:hypothetical protein
MRVFKTLELIVRLTVVKSGFTIPAALQQKAGTSQLNSSRDPEKIPTTVSVLLQVQLETQA